MREGLSCLGGSGRDVHRSIDTESGMSPIDQAGGDLRTALREVADSHAIETIDDVMYAWIFMHPCDGMQIVGSGKLERVRLAVRALNKRISREEWFKIFEASRGYPVP